MGSGITMIKRKEFLKISSLAAVGSFVMPRTSTVSRHAINAIVFDGFAIFDPAPILRTVRELFPEQAKQIIKIWQSRQFTYQWLRVLGHRYKDFWEITKDALEFAMEQCGVNSQQTKKRLILESYDAVRAWPDVFSALQQLKKENLKVCILSNMTEKMLSVGTQNSQLGEYFDHVVSTDELRTYKPSPKAYQMAVEKLKFNRHQILYVPFAGWDLAGAKWFGYPVFWLNRSNSSAEVLQAEPDGKGTTMNELLTFISNYKR